MEDRGEKCVLKYRVVLWLTWYRLCSASVSARLIVCMRVCVCFFFFRLLNVLEVIAPFKHFNKLREFVQMKLPPGFPVKLGEHA